MKKYYKHSLGTAGYKTNELYHGLSIFHDDKKFFYLEYKNKTVFCYTSIITEKPILQL